MNESADDLLASQSELASQLASWRSLLEHPGWEMYAKWVQSQVDTRHKTLALTPLQSFNSALANEYMKGEAGALMLAVQFPGVQKEILETEIQRLSKLIERESNETEKDSSAPASRVEDDNFSRE